VVDINTGSGEIEVTGSKRSISVLNLTSQVSVLNILAIDILSHCAVISGTVVVVTLKVNILTI